MKPPRYKKLMMSIRMPVDLVVQLHEDATRTQMSVTEIIVRAVRTFLGGTTTLKDGDIRAHGRSSREGGTLE